MICIMCAGHESNCMINNLQLQNYLVISNVNCTTNWDGREEIVNSTKASDARIDPYGTSNSTYFIFYGFSIAIASILDILWFNEGYLV